MIILEGVTKLAGTGGSKRQVLVAAGVELPSNRRIAVFGRSAVDKRTFIDLLAGVAVPDAGRIVRNARLSFPAGYIGGFTRELPVRVNVAHVARLYGADVDRVVSFVAQVLKLGEAYNRPYEQLGNAARKNLSAVLAFSIPFDVYLLTDDILQVKDSQFNKDARALFEARAKTSGMIIATEDPDFAREFCDMGLIINDGKLRLFKNLDRAIKVYETTIQRTPLERPRRAMQVSENIPKRTPEERARRRQRRRKRKGAPD